MELPQPTREHQLKLVPTQDTSESERWERQAFSIENNGQNAGTILLRKKMPKEFRDYYGDVAYEIFPRFQGHGLARKACEALIPLAKAEGFSNLLITCDETNIASKKTLERLGAKFLGSLTKHNQPPRLRYLINL